MYSNVYGKKRFLSVFICLMFTVVIQAESQIVNYDTAWTFVYDGGKDSTSGDAYLDCFFDIKALSDGSVICAGYTAIPRMSSVVIRLDSFGKVEFKKNYNTSHTKEMYNGQSVRSIFIAKNSDIIVGGERYNSPWVM